MLSEADLIIPIIYPEHAYSISVNPYSDPTLNNEPTAEWDIQINWIEGRDLDEAKIIQLVLGKSIMEAQILLQEELNLSQQPRISLQPSWWFRLPALPFRINVTQVFDDN